MSSVRSSPVWRSWLPWRWKMLNPPFPLTGNAVCPVLCSGHRGRRGGILAGGLWWLTFHLYSLPFFLFLSLPLSLKLDILPNTWGDKSTLNSPNNAMRHSITNGEEHANEEVPQDDYTGALGPRWQHQHRHIANKRLAPRPSASGEAPRWRVLL